jgi:hypothetical protein
LRRQVGHERKLAIFDAGAFALEAWFLPPTDDDDPIVATVTRSILVGVAGRAPIALRRYRRPAGGRRDVFDPNRRLVDLGVQTLAPGNVAVFRPGVDAFAVVAEPVDRLALVFETRHLEPLRWHYDRRSLRPIRATPTDVSWTRLQETLRLIAALGERTLLPRVIALYAHPSHFVRWSAVQTALALAPEEGRALLRRACRDRHPQLREAARRLWR